MKKNILFILTPMIILLFTEQVFTQEKTSAKSSGYFFDTQNLSSVTELELSSKDIKILPPEIFEMTNLQILDLSYNELSELPKEIKHLQNLRILKLNGNDIYELPEEITRLKFLKEIYLDYNTWYCRLNEVRKITNAKIYLKD